jgi:glucose-6-phosphate 1-dehydrogenase
MSFDLVLFGGTGDLTWRKLMPALFQAWRHGKLPEGGRILAVARDERSDDEYRSFIRERFVEVESAKRPTDEEFGRFAALLHYRRMDLAQPEHYAGLRQWLEARGADTVVFFLATSPHLFTQVCAQLGAAGLNGPHVRVVLEKPLGHDLASAREINRVVRASFSESQAMRIDHYLGKPAVQNLAALRFGNALFEPLWRRESIANIQITIAEGLGVGTRGDFYDRTGALRDMVQNHALQLLTIIAMEPPATGDADAVRDEKLKVLKSLRPFTAESVARDVVRGQYRAGTVGGQAAVGYLEEAKVPADSATETFVALRTEVQNWRWAGVPFYLRTGKRLAARDAQIVVNFRARAARHLCRQRARQQAGDQAATRGRAGTAPAGSQGQRQQRGAGASEARPGLRQGVRHRPRGRVRAPAARRRGGSPEPVRAQRRAGGSLALGGADPVGVARRHRRPAALCGRVLGAAGGQRIDRA